MAIDYSACEAYFHGEIRPLIFEVYTESGIPFTLADDLNTVSDDRAYCEVKDEEGNVISRLGLTMIKDEPSKKTMLCSWNTGDFSLGYYRLQVWVMINVSGNVDRQGNLVIEAKLASEEIIRYIKS